MDQKPEGLKDVKYVIVTVKLKDSTTLDTRGYFVGIRPIVDKDFDVAKVKDMYIWVYRKGSIHMFHLEYYYVSEIYFGSGDKANMSSTKAYKDDEEDQKSAIDRLRDVSICLKLDGSGKDNGLIDYEKYSNVPTAVKEDIEIKVVNKSDNRSGATNYSAGQRPMDKKYDNTHSSGKYVRKEISTLNLKRTTRYPIGEAIEAMNAKIQEIKDDIYDPPKLKRIPADTKKMSAADQEEEDLEDQYPPYMCG